jgi:hypothetical protein
MEPGDIVFIPREKDGEPTITKFVRLTDNTDYGEFLDTEGKTWYCMVDDVMNIFGLPDDYEPTDGELDNIIYLIMKYSVGWMMRQADKFSVLLMSEKEKGPDKIKSVIDNTAEYSWDHIAGEPDEFKPKDIVEHAMPYLSDWFNGTTQEERSDTGEEKNDK